MYGGPGFVGEVLLLLQHVAQPLHRLLAGALLAAGGPYDGRLDPAAVARELAEDGRRLVFFVDDNLFTDRAAATELLRQIRPLGLRWTAQATDSTRIGWIAKISAASRAAVEAPVTILRVYCS